MLFSFWKSPMDLCKKTTRVAIANQLSDLRHDSLNHFKVSTTQGWCKICHKNTRYICEKCNVRLHSDKGAVFCDVSYTFVNQTVFRKLLFLYTYEIFGEVIMNSLIFLLSFNYFVSIYFLFYNLLPGRDYSYVDMLMLLNFMLPNRLTSESKWMGLYTLELELLLSFD